MSVQIIFQIHPERTLNGDLDENVGGDFQRTNSILTKLDWKGLGDFQDRTLFQKTVTPILAGKTIVDVLRENKDSPYTVDKTLQNAKNLLPLQDLMQTYDHEKAGQKYKQSFNKPKLSSVAGRNEEASQKPIFSKSSFVPKNMQENQERNQF